MSSSLKTEDEAIASVGSSSFELSSDEVKDSVRSSFILSSDEVQELCDLCAIGECIEKAALFYCQECKKCMCDDCFEFHRKVSLTRNHYVSQIDEPRIASCQSGNVNELSKHLSNIIVSKTTPGETPAGQTTTSVEPFKTATLTNQFNASLVDDQKPCNINGILVVDSLIYVADFDNGKIKMFDMKGQEVSQLSVPYAFDIASIGKDRIACTSGQQYFNIIDTTGNTFENVITIKTYFKTWGICSYNGHIYVSCHSETNPNIPPLIQIFTTEGKLTKTIQPNLDGKKVLQKPYNICFNQRNGTVYVSDTNVGVIAFSPAGKVQFVKQVFDRSRNNVGITVDEQGQVYVCGFYTNNVMTMPADGSDVSEILKNEIAYAKAVEIVGNQMFLCCYQTDMVRVFTLS